MFLDLVSYISERGNFVEFEELILEYYKDVLLYIKSMSKNDKIAEDITQDTFEKAMKSLEKFDGSTNVRAWLFKIAKNTYFTYYKRQKIYVESETLDYVADNNKNILENLIDGEQSLIIHRFVHKMDEPYKEVFNLRVFSELSFEDIALIFGKNSNWARVTFYRAKKKIIDYMEGKNNE